MSQVQCTGEHVVRFGSSASNRLDPSPVDPVFTSTLAFPIGAAALARPPFFFFFSSGALDADPLQCSRCQRADRCCVFIWSFFFARVHSLLILLLQGLSCRLEHLPQDATNTLGVGILDAEQYGPREAIDGLSLIPCTRAVIPRSRNGPWTRTGLTAGDGWWTLFSARQGCWREMVPRVISSCCNLCDPARNTAAIDLQTREALSTGAFTHAQCTTCSTRKILVFFESFSALRLAPGSVSTQHTRFHHQSAINSLQRQVEKWEMMVMPGTVGRRW